MPRTTIRTDDVNAAADIAQSKLATIAADALSGNMIDGGTISNFASTGIDDNAAAVAMTIESDGDVLIGTTVASTSRLHVYDAGFPAITAERFKSGETNAIRDVANIILKTDADAADGFGPALRFDMTDTSATGTLASIGAVRDGTDDSGAIILRCGAGGSERVRISALGNIVMSGLGGIGNYLATMGDDTVTNITPQCNRGIIFVGSNSTHFGAGAFRCESGAQESYILLNSSGTLNFTTGVLANGTAGTDGKINVSPASDGKIYFNNRLGGGAGIWYTIVGAMW